MGIFGFMSNLSYIQNFSQDNLPLESIDEIISCLKERSLSQKKFLITVVKDQADLLPNSFLQSGAEKSFSVCQIVRHFEHTDFIELLEKLKIYIENWEFVSDNFDTIAKTREVFSIPYEMEISALKDGSGILASKQNLEALKNISPNQLLKINPISIGTGFLVGGSYLLTNHHILPDEETANQCIAKFDDNSNTHYYHEYELAAKELFITEPKLDYTLVQLKSSIYMQQPGYKFGWIPLIERAAEVIPGIPYIKILSNSLALTTVRERLDAVRDKGFQINIEKFENAEKKEQNLIFIWPPNGRQDKISEVLNELQKLLLREMQGFSNSIERYRGDSVIIIQYPKGKGKQFSSLRNNEIINFGVFKDFLRYDTDSDLRSSGSPVFDSNWRLVALNHNFISSPSSMRASEKKTSKSIECYQGVRVSSIIQDLKNKSVDHPKLSSFIEDFVVTSEQLNYPPFVSALKLDGVKNCIVDQIMVNGSSSFCIETWLNPQILKTSSTVFSMYFKEDWARQSSTLGEYILRFYVTPQGDAVVARNMTISGYPEFSLLYPKEVLYLFYPKIYPSSKYPALRINQTGTRIKEFKVFLSIVLNNLGIINQEYRDEAEITDEYDKSTYDNVARFQEVYSQFHPDNTLKIDGIVGPKTLDALWHSLEFKKGDRGMAISMLQAILSFDTLTNARDQQGNFIKKPELLLNHLKAPNAIFDEYTEEAVKQFQQDRIGVANGIVQHETLNSLWSFGSFLREGNCSPSVLELKYTLNSLNLDKDQVPINELFDGQMTEAVKTFQRQHGLVPDGIVGSLTVEAIREAKSCTVPIFDISKMLYFLGFLAHVNTKLDSQEGREAIRQFQSEYGLEVDAIVGKYTLQTLRAATLCKLKEKFNHIAISYDNQTIKIYFNGQLFQSKILQLEFRKSKKIPFLIGAYSQCLHKASYNLLDYFEGALAELRIWNRDRQEPEIQETMFRRLRGDEKNLIGYWRFEKNIHNSINTGITTSPDLNISSSLNSGEDFQWLTAQRYPRLPLPYSIMFSGQGSYIDCSMVNFVAQRFKDKQVDLLTTFSVEAWVKHKFGNCVIVSQLDEIGYGYSLSCFNDKIRVCLQDEKPGEKLIVDTREAIPKNQLWFHIAFVWNESEVLIYLNGRIQDSIVIEGKSRTVTSLEKSMTSGLFDGNFRNLAANLKIGCQDREESYRNVTISEVRLWHKNRSAGQIKKNMSKRLRGDEDGLCGYWRLDDGGKNNQQVWDLSSNKNHGIMQGEAKVAWFPVPSVDVPAIKDL